MTPTRDNKEIEGRSYKDYAYSPVPVSSPSAVYETPPVRESVELNVHGRPSFRTAVHPAERMEKGSKFPQFLAAAAANLSVLATGAAIGWTSPILPVLENDGGPLGSRISRDQSSWIGSLVAVGALVGSFVSGYLGERWGPKRTLLSCIVPFLIGWILVATAGHVAQLYVARFIFGLATAVTFTILPMYCGEIAETSIRGSLGSFLQLFITIGFLYAYAIGPFVSYVVFWILCSILPVIFFVSFMMMPESPYFLLKQGRRDAAIASLAKLRGKSEAAVQKEADEIQEILDDAFKNQVGISELFKVKVNFKALIYTCAMVSFQQFTGINIVLFYMQNIFIAAGGLVPTEIAPIIIGVVQVLASAVTPLVVDRLGRRVLLVFSGIGETVSLCALGLYFYLKEVQHADDVVNQISWLPVASLIIFIATYSVGWGPLPWAVMGEMFASNVKAKASSITVFVCWLLAFIITKFSSNLEVAFNGMFATFWMFGGFCILSILFTVLLLPETKGKTLQQIQDELSGVTSTTSVENGTKK
ncbi:PREDICTED: solute carrier family 2, facilitated glucose transporter member 8-like [Vollenhovia emeryi]|uniref:solute carrier family 2, facilitated glucose transporter member 8-like n=1 Tax=Vollenhovia emeryi TaxID=411798 RepID=UPI0005F4C51A|nr:PREDICTED: solute carrier family 2, facilitated glucose transporter member 8-like [Vollenhovia emeryi]XP_011869617.1 PREDICTED: solute carrier family 2, facilitated glucose transporter member 8-like [Vollenhovia emeryi]